METVNCLPLLNYFLAMTASIVVFGVSHFPLLDFEEITYITLTYSFEIW